MRSRPGSSADLRAFRWLLAPLERKLTAQLEAERLALAVLRRQAGEQRAAVDRADEQYRTHAMCLLPRSGVALDASSHGRSLEYLVVIGSAMAEAQHELGAMQQRIETAAAAVVDCERRLAGLDRLRNRAQDQYAVAQLRAAAKEADLAWLSRHSGPFAARPQGSAT